VRPASSTFDETIDIAVDGESIAATIVRPAKGLVGVLLVHGWGGSQAQYLARAREISALGCLCLTIDLRGHARDESHRESVTREDNLRDVLAGYDTLVGHPSVDPSAIAVVGSSYGGYLAAILSAMRPVNWLALRSPALYPDEEWLVPKRRLDRDRLAVYRCDVIDPSASRALTACAAFRGDVLLVESQEDHLVPHPVIVSYQQAFRESRSMTYRMIDGADHGLTTEAMQQDYTRVLVNWAAEMVIGARKAAPAVATEAIVATARTPTGSTG
jgi:dienelactone hydrolase